jgi:hypothetical protein
MSPGGDGSPRSWSVLTAAELEKLPLPAALQCAPAACDPYSVFQYITHVRRLLLAALPLERADLAGVVALLTREVSSLRSAVARNALCCCAELRPNWRSGLDFAACASPLIGALLSRASNSADKKFIRDIALLALNHCVLAEPSGELLHFLLTLDFTRNKAGALVAAKLGEECVGGALALRALPSAVSANPLSFLLQRP